VKSQIDPSSNNNNPRNFSLLCQDRFDQYINLVQSILNSPNREFEILNTHSELVDSQFVEVLKQSAAVMEEKGYSQKSLSLQYLAESLINKHNFPLTISFSDYSLYLNSFVQLLNEVIISKGDFNILSEILNNNLKMFDDKFASIIRVWAKLTYQLIEQELKHYLGFWLAIFGYSFKNLPHGDHAVNLEIALAAYESALPVYPREEFSHPWGTHYNDLGGVYQDRSYGDKELNIEKAIENYQKTFEVFTETETPIQWARSYFNLGQVYLVRIRMDKKDNLKQAILCYKNALKVDSKSMYPQLVEFAKQNLQKASYQLSQLETKQFALNSIPSLPLTQQRILIELLESVRYYGSNPQTIYSIFQQNLSRFTTDFSKILPKLAKANFEQLSSVHARDLAAIINSFSDLVLYFPLGDKSVNTTIAKAGYESALIIFTKADFPEQWAEIQINLGVSYEENPLADAVQKWENAINCYQKAGQILTREVNLEKWASIQENLGNAYRNRVVGEVKANLQQSITYYQNALQVVTSQQNPRQWGVTQHNLGQTYFKLASLNLNESNQNSEQCLETSIAHFMQSLQTLEKDIYPDLWALCQMSLGNIYNLRLRGDLHENHQKAEDFYQNALQIFTSQNHPYYYQQLRSNQIKLQELKEKLSQKINKDNEAPFVIQVLKRVLASQGDTQKIFPFLEANLHLLNEQFIKDLIGFTTALLESREPHDSSGEIFSVIPLLSTFMMMFRQGNREINLDIAIAGLVMAIPMAKNDPDLKSGLQFQLGIACQEKYEKRFGDLSVNLEETIKCFEDVVNLFPYQNHLTSNDLGIVKNKLGAAYFQRYKINGNVNDINLAINFYNESLEVSQKHSIEWAMVQMNLGNIYCHRKGNIVENLNQAIRYYNNALSILSKEEYCEEWANVHMNLAATYYKLGTLGHSESAENFEKAIDYAKNALEIYDDPDTYPVKWAGLQHNLGVIYSDRRKENPANNIESAINYLEQALTVRTKEKFSYDWADTSKNLGGIYNQRKRGDKQANLRKGIVYCEQALEVFTLEKYPVAWAETEHNLGTLYKNLAICLEHNTEYYQKAISCLKETEKVFRLQTKAWSMVQFELGTCYKNLGVFSQQDRAENLAKSIECYQGALAVTSSETEPFNWAEITNSLGNVYQHNEEYQKAIQCYQDTLQLHTPKGFPLDYIKTKYNLGNTYTKAEDFNNAFACYQEAINILEYLFSEILDKDDDAKRKFGEEWYQLFPAMVEVCLKLGKENPECYAIAWEYVERSKARRLVELFGQIKPTDVSDEIWKIYQDLRNNIANEQKKIEDIEKNNFLLGETSNINRIDPHRLDNIKIELEKLLKINPKLNSFDKIQYTPFKNIGKHLDDDNSVFIQWYILGQKLCAFIYTRHSYQPYVWESSFEDLQSLQKLFQEYFASYNLTFDQWRDQLPKLLERLAEILHIDDLVNYLYKNHQNCQQVILIPHLYLHLFPIHALPIKFVNANQPEYFFECFTEGVRYAPSCQTLLMLEKRLKNKGYSKFEHLFAIQNPTSNLIYADLEVKAIEKYFNTVDILVNQDAEKQKIIDNKLTSIAHCVHFSCHGTFKVESPLESALILANHAHLTLLEIFKLDLNQCRLVTLSACETGITDLTSITDEYIGLPSGFLFAGTPSVVSSFWKVDQVSTAFLLIKFYENLKNYSELKEGDVAIALNKAVTWLRKMTSQEGKQFLQQIQPQIDRMFEGKPELLKSSFIKGAEARINANPKPFSNPFYWSAFSAIGF